MNLTEEQINTVEELLAKHTGKYGLEEVAMGEINPYCFNVAMPISYQDKDVEAAINGFFHELGVLPNETTIKIGDEFDYCELSKNESEECFFAPFNHPAAMKFTEGSPEYAYVLKNERAALGAN